MNKAERAQTYLRDEFFNELYEAQVEFYKSSIFNSHQDDVEGRERALVKLRAIEEFYASIQSIAEQSEIEKKRFRVF